MFQLKITITGVFLFCFLTMSGFALAENYGYVSGVFGKSVLTNEPDYRPDNAVDGACGVCFNLWVDNTKSDKRIQDCKMYGIQRKCPDGSGRYYFAKRDHSSTSSKSKNSTAKAKDKKSPSGGTAANPTSSTNQETNKPPREITESDYRSKFDNSPATPNGTQNASNKINYDSVVETENDLAHSTTSPNVGLTYKQPTLKKENYALDTNKNLNVSGEFNSNSDGATPPHHPTPSTSAAGTGSNPSSSAQAGLDHNANNDAQQAINNSERFTGTNISNPEVEIGNASEDCSHAQDWNDQYGCKGTKTLIKTSQFTNQFSQVMGTTITNTAGQMNASKASTEGTQSAALKAAAKTADLSANSQIMSGTMNLGMGMAQLVKAYDHNEEGGKINSASPKVKADTNTAQTETYGNLGQVKFYTTLAATATGDASAERAFTDMKAGFEENIRSKNTIYNKQLTNLNTNYKQCIATNPPCSKVAQFKQEFDRIENLYNQEVQALERNATLRLKTHQKVSVTEKTNISDLATAGGIQSMVLGIGQTAQGMLSKSAASEMEEAARKLAAVENTPSPIIAPSANPLPMDEFKPSSGNAITGTGFVDSASTPADSSADDTIAGGKELGDGFNTGGKNTDLQNPGPKPDPGKPGPGNAGAPGGGAGGINTAGTSNASNPPSEEQPRPVGDSNPVTYSPSGGGVAAMAGGFRGGDKGTDLSGLLAQFLPKPEDSQKNQNGILDYGRRPSSGNLQADGVLGPNSRSLFKRIEERYTFCAKQGCVR